MNSKKGNFFDLVSTLCNILSIVLSITALYIGISQFEKSLDRTDKQIDILISERNRQIDSDRPLLTVSPGKIEVYKVRPFDYPPGWYYKMNISNIGTRPAHGLNVAGIVLPTGKDLKEVDSIIKSQTFYINPINKDQSIEFVGGANLKNLKTYYLKLVIEYSDKVTNRKYTEVFYYKADLHELFRDNEYIDEFINDFNGVSVDKLDSIFEKSPIAIFR